MGACVLITGSVRRIGAAIASEFAARGARLHLHANTSTAELAAFAERLRVEHSVIVHTHQADLSDPVQVERFLADVRATGARPDVVVNNASMFQEYYSATDLLDISHMTRLFTLNVMTPIVLAGMVAEAGAGQVINLVDSHIDLCCGQHVPYDVTKAALADATKRLAVMLAPRVRVNAIAPGLVLPPPGRDEEYLAELARPAPLGTPSSVADVVAAVRFLYDTSSVTGEIIMVDSGEHLL